MGQTNRLERYSNNPQQTLLFANIYQLQMQLDKLAEAPTFLSCFFPSSKTHLASELSDRLESIDNELSWYELTKEVLTNYNDEQIKTLFKMAFVEHAFGKEQVKNEAERLNNSRIETVSRYQVPPQGSFGASLLFLLNPQTEQEVYEQKYRLLEARYESLPQRNKPSESL